MRHNCPIEDTKAISRPSALAATVGTLVGSPTGDPSTGPAAQPLDQAVCSMLLIKSPAIKTISLPSPLRAIATGHSPPTPAADQPDQPLLQAVCQMCQSSPPMSKTNSSSRPSPLGISSGAPKSLAISPLLAFFTRRSSQACADLSRSIRSVGIFLIVRCRAELCPPSQQTATCFS